MILAFHELFSAAGTWNVHVYLTISQLNISKITRTQTVSYPFAGEIKSYTTSSPCHVFISRPHEHVCGSGFRLGPHLPEYSRILVVIQQLQLFLIRCAWQRFPISRTVICFAVWFHECPMLVRIIRNLYYFETNLEIVTDNIVTSKECIDTCTWLFNTLATSVHVSNVLNNQPWSCDVSIYMYSHSHKRWTYI